MNIKELGISEKQLKRMLAGKKTHPKIIRQQMTTKEFTFGIVSDTHFCSTHEKLDQLHTFYAICKKQGIKTVVHAGDIMSGWGIYHGQENEVHTYGSAGQAKYVIDNYPKVPGITTYFITGNHDLSWFNRSGVDVGVLIAEKRPDMIYIGQYQGDVVLGGVKVRLIHPDGGGAYAISYKGQKLAESIASGDKPHIMVLGHYHTSVYFFYRNIHILYGGCFEGQSTFLLRKGISPAIGGWTLKVHVAQDKRNSVVAATPTFIPFFT